MTQSMFPHRCYIGLGSNLAKPVEQLHNALQAIQAHPNLALSRTSSLYQSTPVGPVAQPDFINSVACLQTDLSPLALLDTLQSLEQQAGRERLEHWGPRTLDLDLLLYNAETVQLPRLTVPHPEMFKRAFVLIPLYEIAPALQFPDGSLLQDRYSDINQEGVTKLTDS